jgi:hypothetical protein
MTLAVVVIASEKRMNTTFPVVMQSVLEEEPDEIVSVADFHCAGLWRHIMIPAFTKTTIDALIKRDVGTVATGSRCVMYLSDDHRPVPGFVETFRQEYEPSRDWDVLAPARVAVRDGQAVKLNMGEGTQYVAGHAGIYRREILQVLPWTATIPHPNWDVIHTHHLIANGARLAYADTDLSVEDIEPGATPWL